MTAIHKFELAFHLKSFRNIGLRQGCILQLRTFAYAKNEKQTLAAKPYQIIKLQQKEGRDENNQPLIEDDMFITPRIIVKPNEKIINLDLLCLFKGQVQIPLSNKYHHQVVIFSELIWYQGTEVEVIGQWKGYSNKINFQSYLDVYFSTHLITCSISGSVHCLFSQLQIKNEQKLLQSVKQPKFMNHLTKKKQSLYDSCIEPLIHSLKLIGNWCNQYQSNHYEQIKRSLSGSKVQCPDPSINWKYNHMKAKKGSMINQKLKKQLDSLNCIEYLLNIKQDTYHISSTLYPLWKQFVSLHKKYPQSKYLANLKQKYHQYLQKDHWQKRIILTDGKNEVLNQKNDKTQKQQLLNQNQSIQFCSVQQNSSKIKISIQDFQILNKNIHKKKDKLIVLVHGFQASSFDMDTIAMYVKFRNPDCYLLISQSNEGMTQGVIEECGHRLAVQVKNFINIKGLKQFTISLIGHSLGGIIIRAALQYLQLYKNNFQCYISIGSPHMGYLYHTSTIVTTSLWVLNQVRKDQSMIELAMSDNKDLRKCYMYELSERNELNWFNTIILIGSKEDQYVPFSSALLQSMEFLIESQSAKVYRAMHNNIMRSVQDKAVRLEIVFNDKIKDLSSFIGRTAHIKVLSFLPIIQLYCHLISRRL